MKCKFCGEEIEKAYWQGYIAKQNEAIEICKICKYMKKARDLESENYEQNNIINSYIEEREKLIDKLEEDIEKFNRKENVFMTQSSQINASLISYINEILSIVKDNKKTTFPKK